jgi:hypothetical protein
MADSRVLQVKFPLYATSRVIVQLAGGVEPCDFLPFNLDEPELPVEAVGGSRPARTSLLGAVENLESVRMCRLSSSI